MNKVNLIGRLTKEIELKYTKDQKAVARFTLAVDRYANGNKQADFINCVAFSKTAELIERFVTKGQQLALSGNLKTGSYEKDGKKVFTTDVIVESITLIGSKAENEREDFGFKEATEDIPF